MKKVTLVVDKPVVDYWLNEARDELEYWERIEIADPLSPNPTRLEMIASWKAAILNLESALASNPETKEFNITAWRATDLEDKRYVILAETDFQEIVTMLRNAPNINMNVTDLAQTVNDPAQSHAAAQ